MAKIQITEGVWNTSDCTTDLNLTQAHAKDPAAGYDKVIMYGEKRYLMTFIAAGATNGAFTVARTTDSYKTRIPSVPQSELIDGNAWRYKIMGRIQKASTILSQVGNVTEATTTVGGWFQLKMRDNLLVYGMNAIFYNGKMARVMAQPTGGKGAYIYQFQAYPGDTFSYATWVTPQIGEKTCFGGYTTYGERSLTGYGRTFYPEDFIQHFSIQRKGQAITGDANANRVLWYAVKGVPGAKGWIYWIEAQARSQLLLEDDFHFKWGRSTMKDTAGNLLAAPSMIDQETGMPIYAGDGLYPQIEGANDMETSGTNGKAVWDDFVDQVKALKRRSNSDGGQLYYCVTGLDGMSTVNSQAHLYAKDNFNMTFNVNQTDAIGGAGPPIGWWFQRINVEGCQVHFIVDPMMDDEERFPRRLSDGTLAMSNTFYFIDASPDNTGKPNVEIRTKGRDGVNRNMIYFYENGMTGDGEPKSAVDGKEFQMLKQNMFVIYNTKSCGILSPPATS